MEFKNLYDLSKDYKRLYALLLENYEVICVVDYTFWNSDLAPCRDVCRARNYSDRIQFTSRGIEYGSSETNNFAEFLDSCERMKLQFIEGRSEAELSVLEHFKF